MSALVEARESLTYWERRLDRLPRHAVRKRREAREMAARWRTRVIEAERLEYGAGVLGALLLYVFERRLPVRAHQTATDAGARGDRRRGRGDGHADRRAGRGGGAARRDLLDVLCDVDDGPVRVADEEPADAPRLVGERVDDLQAERYGFLVERVDVGDLD